MINRLTEKNNPNNLLIYKLNEIKDTIDKSTYDNYKISSLVGGSAGIALFYFYCSKYTSNENCYDKGYELISNIFDSINQGEGYYSFSNGITGIGWLIEHLEEQGFIDSDTNEMLSGLDVFAYDRMIFEIQSKNFDFLHGALGIGFYLLSRLKKNREVEKYLINLLDELEKESELDTNGGLRWPPLKHTQHTNELLTNLSISHGNASIVVFLSKIYENNILKEKAYRLLNGAITYILQNQLDPSIYYSSFPSVITKLGNPSNSRLAWCYGDLGIGVAIYQAGKITKNNHWENKAIEILLRTTKRRNKNVTDVTDAGLCHGTAGIAHIYYRMYKNTKIDVFKESSDYWFSKTLDMAKFDDGLAGYKAYRKKETGGDLKEYGLLEGIAGIGLAIISYLSDIEPTWDGCLLLS